MNVAAVTMVYNEAEFLPIWVRHYSRQVGAEHCYVIDHGSDDGSTDELGEVNVARLPRSPHDDVRRARFLSEFCAGLLHWYDWVIHTDVDEIAIAEPRFYAALPEYCATLRQPVATAVGLDLHHLPDDEPPIDPDRPITEQRRWARFTGAMCKPALIQRPVNWSTGFQRADAPIAFGELFLFHLRWFDRDMGLKRLAKTRAMPSVHVDATWSHRISDDRYREKLAHLARLPRREHVSFDVSLPPLSNATSAVLGAEAGRDGQPESFRMNLEVDELWALPPRFRGTF
jgi:hypothetical protein